MVPGCRAPPVLPEAVSRAKGLPRPGEMCYDTARLGRRLTTYQPQSRRDTHTQGGGPMVRHSPCACLAALLAATLAYAEQMGGPSGPANGEWRLGGEAVLRTDMDADLTVDGIFVPGEVLTDTFYGVLEYGITDRLSIRGKGGVSRLEFLPGPMPGRANFEYGPAWAAGIQYRICAPRRHGTSLAIRGQFARSAPDDFVTGMGSLTDLNIEEWNAALVAGATGSRARPYIGAVYSDLQADFVDTGLQPVGRGVLEKRDHLGAIVGLDADLGDHLLLNLEARAFDEQGITGGLHWRW